MESACCVTQCMPLRRKEVWIAGEGSLASCGARDHKLEKCDLASGRG